MSAYMALPTGEKNEVIRYLLQKCHNMFTCEKCDTTGTQFALPSASFSSIYLACNIQNCGHKNQGPSVIRKRLATAEKVRASAPQEKLHNQENADVPDTCPMIRQISTESKTAPALNDDSKVLEYLRVENQLLRAQLPSRTDLLKSQSKHTSELTTPTGHLNKKIDGLSSFQQNASHPNGTQKVLQTHSEKAS